MPENAKQPKNIKVVHLEPESQRRARARLARLPAAVHALHEKGKFQLAEKLKVFFDQADDSLFSLADKASSNQEQNIYFDSMREVRVQRRGFENRFGNAIDDAFAALVTNAHAAAEKELLLAADELSLVNHEELEEMVALDSSVSRASSEFGNEIQVLSLRLDTLVPVKVYEKNNPLGPSVIADAFMGQAKRLDIDIKAKLVLFKLFDRVVMQNLASLYSAVNQILIDNNVLPQLSQGVSSPGAAARAVPVKSVQAPAGTTAQSPSENSEVVSLLKELLAERQKNTAASAHSSVSEVVRLLSLAQQAPAQVSGGLEGKTALDLITDIQQRSGSTVGVGRTEQEIINLVDMLFKFILEDRNLAEEMKAVISRMQIPLVKVALLDKSFFAKGGHAARRLLNEMATAALGWQPAKAGEQGGNGDPLHQKMQSVVQTLLNQFDTDVAIFTELLADFTSFVEKDRRRAELLERRTLDAEDGKAKTEMARMTVAAEIELRTVDVQLPPVVLNLIEGPWNNVLFATVLKSGNESEAWQTGLKTLEDLIWSTQVPATAEDRKRLIAMVPDLLQRLRAGLDYIAFNPFEMSEIFKALESVHLECIRGKHSEVSSVAPAQKVVNPMKESVAGGKIPQEKTTSQKSALHKAVSREVDLNPIPGAEGDTAQAGAKAQNMDESIDESALEQELTAADAELGDVDDFLADVDAALDFTAPEEQKLQAKTASVKPVTKTVSNKPKVVEKVAEAQLPDNDPFMQQVASFVQGAWFDMTDEDSNVSRCRLAAVIKPTGKYIFVNRSGMKVAEKQQQELAYLLMQNRIRALDNSMLFDRALETVVTSLRKP